MWWLDCALCFWGGGIEGFGNAGSEMIGEDGEEVE